MVDEIKNHYVDTGTSGTDISGGRFFEEYLRALQSVQGPEIYDEMRRGDDQVAMLLRVVKNPIMSANWFISPPDDTPEQKKITDFVSHVLMDDMGTEENPKTFEKFKRESLTCVEFGYSLFEVTNKIVFDDPEFGNYVGINGLDWRSPKTIEEWHVSRGGVLQSVRQLDSSERGGDFLIDGRYLLHIAPEMEGDNYEGISMLRPVYGNWVRKDFLRKINMIGYERAATGIPIGEIPRGQENTPSQTALEDSLSRFVAHERQYLTAPEGFNITSLKIEHDGEKLQGSIDSENKGMSKSFLANFMELGVSGSGSHALAISLSDIFLSGLTVYANSVKEPINVKLIPHIVKANFGKQEKYPELKIEGINDKAGEDFATILTMLGEKGFIQLSDRMMQFVHKRFKLPEFDPGLTSPAPALPNQPGGAGVGDAKNGDTGSSGGKNTSAAGKQIILSLAEKSVSKSIESMGAEMTSIMQTGILPRAAELVKNMMAIWRNAPRADRMNQVNRLNVPGKAKYKKSISEFLAGTYVLATDGVKNELSSDGLQLAEPTKEEVKALPSESKATGASQAELIIESQDADLKKDLYFSFTSKADVLPTEQQMESNLLAVVNKYLTGPSVRVSGPNAVANAVNLARNAIFQKKEVLDRIESFVFTNPSPTAAVCVHLAGRVFTKEEYIVTSNVPPLHHNCNSWIQAQVIGNQGNKSLSPAGLSIQGTDNQIETIEKSIRF